MGGVGDVGNEVQSRPSLFQMAKTQKKSVRDSGLSEKTG